MNKRRKNQQVSFGLANARSLWEKTNSLADCFKELGLSFAVIKETWFHEGQQLDKLAIDIHGEHGLSMINKMRKKNGRNNPGGGVSIVFDKTKIKLKEHKVTRGRLEIVAATGKFPNNTRPFYIIGVYISTRLRANSFHDLLSCLSDIILKIKTEVSSPYIVLAGDFNNKKIDEAIGDYPDMTIVMSGATRGNAVLDEVATSFTSELTGVASPTMDGPRITRVHGLRL